MTIRKDPAAVIKWKKDGTPAYLESIEDHKVQLSNGKVKAVEIKCKRRYTGVEDYVPAEKPAEKGAGK